MLIICVLNLSFFLVLLATISAQRNTLKSQVRSVNPPIGRKYQVQNLPMCSKFKNDLKPGKPIFVSERQWKIKGLDFLLGSDESFSASISSQATRGRLEGEKSASLSPHRAKEASLLSIPKDLQGAVKREIIGGVKGYQVNSCMFPVAVGDPLNSTSATTGQGVLSISRGDPWCPGTHCLRWSNFYGAYRYLCCPLWFNYSQWMWRCDGPGSIC